MKYEIPKNMEEAVKFLEDNLYINDLNDIDKSETPNIMISFHHGVGTFIRNTWKLWNIEESPLCEYFKERDITHADEMSHHILMALWHKRHDGGPGEEDGPWAKGWEERSTPAGGIVGQHLDLYMASSDTPE